MLGEIAAAGGEAFFAKADVLDKASLEEACKVIVDKWGRVDVLVNGAGGNQPKATVGPDDSFFDVPKDAMDKVLSLNLMGTLIPSQVFGKAIAAHGDGCIVNVSSMAAQQPLTRVLGYSAAKAAVDNFTKWLSVELATKVSPKIRVNAIAPGFFLADQNRRLLTNEDGSLTSRGQTIVSQTPMGRFGDPEELVGALVWLCSPAAKFVTGTVVAVDGGFGGFGGV